MPASSLTLRLSGRFASRTEAGALTLSLRGQAILAVLVAEGGRIGRADLSTLIWGDRAEEQARASLRQELSALRRVLPEGLLTADRSDVTLALDCVTLDPPEDGAEFLAGMDLRSEGFEDWLRLARIRDREARLAADLAASEAATTPAEAAAAAVRALALDPVSEPAVRVLMRAEAARGNATAGLRAFARFEATLRSTLDAAPSEETRALAAALRTPGQGVLPASARVAGHRPRLAVLPFENLDPEARDMLADGIVEEVTGALSRVAEFHVIARQSAFALQAQGRDAAAALGAEYLVQGSVRRSGDRVRIAVTLVQGKTGHTLWSERFDDRMDDLFDLQDRIAAKVAGQISPNLRLAEIALVATAPPEDRTAYDLVLSAYPHLWALNKTDNGIAIDLLGQAVALRPDHPHALALLAWCTAQALPYMWSDDPARDRAQALQLTERAIAMGTDHAPTLTAIGAAITMAAGDLDRARFYLDRALAIDPNNAWAWMRLGWVEVYRGAYQIGLDLFDQAERLSPLDPFRYNWLIGKAVALYRGRGRYDEAVRLIEDALRLNPGLTYTLRILIQIHSAQGNAEAAAEAARMFRRRHPEVTIGYLRASLPFSMYGAYSGYLEVLQQAGVPA